MNTLSLPRPATAHPSLRAKFTDGGLATASGPKVIQLCYERLDRDLDSALEAIERRDVPVAHEMLRHAQDLVNELLCMLDVERWEHAPALASIYRYVLELLTQANVKKSPVPAREAKHLLGELGDAFRIAGAGLVAEAASSPTPTAPLVSQFSARA